MNCLDFRRDVLAQPLKPGEEARSHALDCASCREFLARQRELDEELVQALQVPVPDGLADRVLVAQGIRSGARLWPWAAAASVAIAVALGVLAPPFLAGDALAREAIVHLREEPQSLRLVTAHDPGLLTQALASQGMRLAVTLGQVTYAKLCPMAQGKAHHVVVATAHGPVTLFLLPGDAVARKRTLVESEGATAITIPAARGSIAIVAATREQALAAERALALA